MMCRILCTIIAIISFVCASAQTNDIDKERIRAAVERMIAQYPHSTLQDIYKSFFQDRFGPGHLVADTAKAISYLRTELDEAKETGIMLYEPTGDQGNFYRVSLATVTGGKITFDTYATAFLKSLSSPTEADVESWTDEWRIIETVIRGMNLGLPGYEKDAAAIMQLLSEGHYAVHHSHVYNQHYAPHYRIIARDIFEKEIRPLLK